jgi:hypothetical protein
VAGPLVYDDATFTSASGSFFINGAGIGKDICAFNSINCNDILTVDFTTTANGLVFQTAGDDSIGTLFVDIFLLDGSILFAGFLYDDIFTTLDTHDLSGYTDIVKLVMRSDDGAGVTYDNFSFTVGDGGGGGGIPEPASWALMIAGFGLVGAKVRQRRIVMVS